MDSQSPIACHKCKQVPYDILMMNCGHNLCVKCAAQRKKNQGNILMSKSTIKKSSLSCQFCNSKTALDGESVLQLDKVIQNKIPSSKLQTIKKQMIFGSTKRLQTPMNSRRNSPRQNTTVIQKMRQIRQNQNECERHPQQPVMYFCFTCKCSCFCAECVLTGRHQDHQVKTIKKAYNNYEQQFQDVVKSTKNFIKTLYSEKKSLADGINSTKNKIDSMKKQIQKTFDQIRLVIRSKQQQIIKCLQTHMKSILAQTNGSKKADIEDRINQQQTFLKKYQQKMKKGQVIAMQYFRSICQITMHFNGRTKSKNNYQIKNFRKNKINQHLIHLLLNISINQSIKLMASNYQKNQGANDYLQMYKIFQLFKNIRMMNEFQQEYHQIRNKIQCRIKQLQSNIADQNITMPSSILTYRNITQQYSQNKKQERLSHQQQTKLYEKNSKSICENQRLKLIKQKQSDFDGSIAQILKENAKCQQQISDNLKVLSQRLSNHSQKNQDITKMHQYPSRLSVQNNHKNNSYRQTNSFLSSPKTRQEYRMKSSQSRLKLHRSSKKCNRFDKNYYFTGQKQKQAKIHQKKVCQHKIDQQYYGYIDKDINYRCPYHQAKAIQKKVIKRKKDKMRKNTLGNKAKNKTEINSKDYYLQNEKLRRQLLCHTALDFIKKYKLQ